MKKQLYGWGFGLYADRSGALHDTFPRKDSEGKTKRARSKWRVKPLKKKLVLAP